MSNTLKFAPVLLAGLAAFTSCTSKNDDPTPIVVESPTPIVNQQNLYPTPSVKLGYTVHVLPSSVANARIEGLTGATVTVKQNGKEYTTTTDQTGIATFSGLIEGAVNIFIKKEGYLSVNISDNIEYDGNLAINGVGGNSTGSSSVTVNNEQYSSSQFDVTLPKLGAKLEAIVIADLDGEGTLSSLSSGDVQLLIDNSFEPNVFAAKVSNGVLLVENLPEGVNFELRTVNVFKTVPKAGSFPAFKKDLDFPAKVYARLKTGSTTQLGVLDLQ